MASSLIGALRVVLGLDQAQFERGLSAAEAKLKTTGQKMQKIGAGMARVGAGLTLGVTAPLIAFASKATAAANASADAAAQVASALQSMGNAAGRTQEQLKEQARGLQAISTFDDDDILRKVTANLLTFGNVSEGVFDRAQVAAVNLSARLGQDLQSSAIQLGKALNDPIKGVTALQRVGVSFTEKQKEQIKALVESGKTYEAQGIILSELEKQFAGAAQAARDAAPGSDTIDSFREFEETIGKIIVDVLPILTDFLNGLLTQFNNLSPEMQQLAVVGGALAVALGPLLTGLGAIVTIVGGMLPLLIKLGPAFAAIATFITGTLLPALATLGRVLLGMLVGTGPIGWLLLAITGVVIAWKNWDKIGPIVKNLYNQVKTWIMDKMAGIFTWLSEKIQSAIKWFKDMYVAVVGNSYVPDMVKEIGDEIAKLQKNMVEPVQKATKDVKEAFEQLKNSTNMILRELFPEEAAELDYLTKVKTLTDAMKAGIITAERYETALSFLKENKDTARLGEKEGPSFSDPKEKNNLFGDGVDYKKLENDISGAMSNINKMFDATKEKGTEFTDGLAMSFSYAIEDIILGFGSVEDAAKALLADLTQMFFREFVTKQIFKFLSTAFAGGFASGGTIPAGQWGVVGEEGPEIAYAGSRPLQIASNSDSQEMVGGSGGNSTFNINVSGVMSERDARRTGKMIAAEAGRHWDTARRQGIVG